MAKRDPPTIFVLDDDAAVRTALARLIRAAGLHAVALADMDELLNMQSMPARACVVADVRMRGTSGLALPHLLAQRGHDLPVIYVSAQDTESTRAEAKKAGAVGFFRKPVDDQALLDAIAWAIDGNDHAGSNLNMP